MPTDCHSLRSALVEHLTERTEVQQVRNMCVVTLPLLTIDNRLVDVFLEQPYDNYFMIHDGCKAVNELILQGMKITPSIEREFGLIAKKFGVAYSDEMFQTGATIAEVASKTYSVAMCSALAMTNLLEHEPMEQEESIEVQLGAMLRRWSRSRAKVDEDVKVDGELKQHSFNFVVRPKRREPISISVLNPTAGALAAAERYGFKVKDLESTSVGKWKRMAIEAKSEVWSQDARNIVDKCANQVVPVRSGDPVDYGQISSALTRLAS